MEDGVQKDCVAAVRRCLKSKKLHHFWLFEKDEYGEPWFNVDRRPAPLKKTAREMKKRAKVKLMAHGELHSGEDGLIFVNEGALPAKRVVRIFKKLAKEGEFKKIAPYLKNAQIYTPEEYAMLGAEEDEEVSDYEGLVDRARDMLDDLQRAFRDTEAESSIEGMERALDAAVERAEKKGDTDGAIEALKAWIDDADERAAAAWSEVAAPVKLAFQSARAALQDSFSPGRFAELFAPFEAAQERAIRLKKAKRWLRSIHTLMGLAEELDGLDVRSLQDEDEREPEAPPPAVTPAADTGLMDPEAVDLEAVDIEDELALDVLGELELAERDWVAAGRPTVAGKALHKVRQLIGQGRFEDAAAKLSAFREALDEARLSARTPSLRRLAALRLELPTVLDQMSSAIEDYIREVESDDELPQDTWREVQKDFVANARGLLPQLSSKLYDAIDDAINGEGETRRRAAQDACRLVSEELAAVRVQSKLVQGGLENSAFGKFEVHTHILNTLQGIADATAQLSR